MSENIEKVIPNVDSKSKEERNVPDLRFDNFTDVWVLKRINETCEVNPKTKSLPEVFNYIDLESVKNGELIKTNIINIKNAPSRAQRLLKKGDVLFSCVRPYQHNNYIYTDDVISVASTGFACLRTKISSDFLYEVINTSNFENKVMERCTGTSYPAINSNDLGNIKVYIPSFDEELKIGNFMSLINKRILTQKKIINNLESLINTIKNKIFNNEVCISKTPLKDILIEINRKSTVNNQFPVISSTVKGLVLQSEYFDKEIASENNIGYKIISKDNIILSPQNLWMGNITYNDKFENGIVSPSYKIFYISEKYNGKYIFEMLTTKKAFYYYKTVSEQGASVVRRNLNYEAFMELMFNVPPKETQDHDIKILESYNDKLTNEKKILLAYEKQKQYLLNHMFI